MNLSDYIQEPKRRSDLAAALHTSPDYLWQLATRWRNKRPSRLMALAIESETGGVVPFRELRPDLAASGYRKRKRA